MVSTTWEEYIIRTPDRDITEWACYVYEEKPPGRRIIGYGPGTGRKNIKWKYEGGDYISYHKKEDFEPR